MANIKLETETERETNKKLKRTTYKGYKGTCISGTKTHKQSIKKNQ